MKAKVIIISFIIIAVLAGIFTVLSIEPKQPEKLSTNSNTAPINQNMAQLKIEDIQIGTGREVKAGDIISINYLGTLEDGTKFDSSYDRGQPFETPIGVGYVIPGWDQGVVGMKVGGKRKLTIPYDLAYGEQGIPGVIPPKSTLIFEVELMGIK